MLVPKKARLAVYEYLFTEGVLVCSTDTNLPKHKGTGVRNLYVINLMKSFKSRGYVNETYSWKYCYYYLTDEGIEYLRSYLHSPADVVPNTMKNPRGAAGRGEREGGRGGERGDRGPRREFGGGRGGGAPGSAKKAGPGADFKPEFAGEGAGRGQ